MMEVYAGFLTHTDAQVGRVLDFIDQLGETDNTIVLVMSDNGASAEGGPGGSFNELYFFNFVPESLEENLRRIDDLGTPRANNHYPWGWAWAGNTPLKRFKRDTHEGGVCDPLIVHWPARLGAAARRTGTSTCTPSTCCRRCSSSIGIDAPAEIDGVAQTPFDGVSFAHTLDDAAARRRAIDTQYYEMLGSRALYHDGWKAVVFHPPAHDGLRRQRRAAQLRRRRLGAVPRRRGLLGVSRRRRPAPREARGAEGPVVAGGGTQPGAAAQQPAGPLRRPPLPARALRVPRPASRRSRRRSRRTCATGRSRSSRARRPGRRPVRRRRSSPTAATAAATRSTSPAAACTTSNNLLGAQLTTVSASVELPVGPVSCARDVHADRPVPGRRRALVRRRAGRPRPHRR